MISVKDSENKANTALMTERGMHATRSLLSLAASGAEGLNPCEGTVRPRPARQVPVKQEPGTAQAGKSGTAPARAGAAT
jgi:hypothetical protein